MMLNFIRQIRNAVHDPNPPPSEVRDHVLYSDHLYEDAIMFALNKLNLDLRNLTDVTPPPPWTINTLPDMLSFLLIKLASIQMAQIRGAENAGDIMIETSAGADVTQISVPDLSISKGADANLNAGPVYWKSLWDRLQKEYDGELKRLVSESAPVSTGIKKGILRHKRVYTGDYAYQLNKGLPASVLAMTRTTTTVTASWTPVYATTFSYYSFEHTLPSGDIEVLAQLSDNHTCTVTVDLVLSSGLHSFYIKTYNLAGVGVKSNEIAVRV